MKHHNKGLTGAPKTGTIAPDMSTTHRKDTISSALFGATRRAVLGLLFGQPHESFYLREIARRVRSGQGAVQRELGRLAAAGIATRTRKGRAVAPASRGRIVATYPYRDASGKLLYEVVRFKSKSFRQRRPGPDGQWR